MTTATVRKKLGFWTVVVVIIAITFWWVSGPKAQQSRSTVQTAMLSDMQSVSRSGRRWRDNRQMDDLHDAVVGAAKDAA